MLRRQNSTKRQKSTTQKAPDSATPTIRGAIIGLDDLTTVRSTGVLASLKKPPDVVSSWIGEKPGNFVQLESSGKDNTGNITGFNEIAWREEISSKLFGPNQYSSKLYLENLNSEGNIKGRFKVTYPDVKRLANESKWEYYLPDTIVVKSAGGKVTRMAAKQMVLGLLDSYQSDLNQSNWKFPNKPILKETKSDAKDDQFAIEFSVKGITQLEPIMGLGTYMDQYSHFFSDGLLEALKNYQYKLRAGVDTGFRVEEVASTKWGDAAAKKMFQDISDAADDLQKALKTEMEGTAGPGLDTLRSMRTQVKSAITDRFKNEFDTRRWQQWRALKPKPLTEEKPLTEDDIVPGTGAKVGKGLQGSVFKYELDLALKKRPVVVKYDSNGLNDNATNAGIPELNPQQSVRAVAAFEMSKQLGLQVIPKTEFFVGTDADGRPKLGQAMEFVTGAIGQRTVGVKNIKTPNSQNEIQAFEDMVNNPGNQHPLEVRASRDALHDYVKVDDTWYRAQVFPVDINYGDAVVQKGLSDLQVFDYIIGHADRNPGNWIYEKDKNGNIIGVKGIDNDDTFGEKWALKNPNYHFPSERGSKTPGIPPIVDISTALSILSADFNQVIKPFLAGLSPDEITKAAVRFARVQQEVRQRVTAGKIASMGDVDQAKLLQLRNKVPDMVPMPDIPRWGTQEIADTHTDQNSYLGLQVSVKTYLAKQYSKTGGVLPESGDALL